MDSKEIKLWCWRGPALWGFWPQVCKDFNVPFSISWLTQSWSIDGENAEGLIHIEAQNKIHACGESLSLGLSRAQPPQRKQQKALAPHHGPPSPHSHPLLPSTIHLAFGATPLADSWLMEDLEDWQPNSGTGQSHSFCILAHLTSTEFMQDLMRRKTVLELQSPCHTHLQDWHPWHSAHVLNMQW
ncbi:hypothetical protein K5549_020291 [Capra hircus]|uniref:Uncharacterized protein n=1 Tax=Capra hircus TaxID=9925 RepID=A0A452EKZ9_CAPHI|nr:hypothetical protein K5549_020291 [Capra hircus]